MAIVAMLPLFLNNNANAEKPLPGLTLELTQKYGKKINDLIEFYQCNPYDSNNYKFLQQGAVDAIKKVIKFRKLLDLPEPTSNCIETVLKLNDFSPGCIKAVLSLYNEPVLDKETAYKLCNDPPAFQRLLKNSNKVIPYAEKSINCAQEFLEVQYRALLLIASDYEIDLNNDSF